MMKGVTIICMIMCTSFSRHSVSFYYTSARRSLSGDGKQVQVHLCKYLAETTLSHDNNTKQI